METFTLTRKEISGLLRCLQGHSEKTPLQVLQQAWASRHQQDLEAGTSFAAFVSTALPSIFTKLIKTQPVHHLSLHDIVALGNQIEYTTFSITSVQNWVKRDFKEMLVKNKKGRKYCVNQIALLFMIEDFKTNLDFESIRGLFRAVFGDFRTDEDDLLEPVDIYAIYANMAEEIETDKTQHMEQVIRNKADRFVHSLVHLNEEQKEAVRNMIMIGVISIQTAFCQHLAKKYINATLFLQHLHKDKG
ncbi:DUF1836 domain-containing protein [Paenibacillus larvae]|uniref:DUF1836 domain-containing protein n=1 Tax=Paenibacillus larvae TaxID=1464 RepID=UPI00227FF6D3|nr:DUF1836 domain-containing protein [Paenibacillus larvae]MCY9510101.1 DUF1836 domain-containing protein [Paenibacillus larvae]MCY9526030.1 DUF1836 domain-containing protein [Paenibacillus larvae]